MESTSTITSNPEDQTNHERCCMCNPQVCSSYVLGMFACVLVIGGVFLSFHKWDYMWLIVSAIGIVLILMGALLHFCGSRPKRDAENRNSLNEQDLHEHLLPTAPSLNNAYSVSQLSLNMLPPYFTALDNMFLSQMSPSAPPNNDNISQIVQIKGQSFILLPISENIITNENENNTTRWSNPVPVASKEQTENRLNAKIQTPVIAVPVKEDCGCQTDNLNQRQTAETANDLLSSPPRSEIETQTSSVVINKPSTAVVSAEDESLCSSSVINHTEVCQVDTQQQNLSNAITDCNSLPDTECNSENEIPESISQEVTESDTLECEEPSDTTTTDCQTEITLPEDEVNMLTDDNANTNNTVPEIIPSSSDSSTESLAEPPNAIDNNVNELNNNCTENNSNSRSYITGIENRINSDINENFTEPSILVTDLVNNNDLEVDNMHIPINNNNNNCIDYLSINTDTTHNISSNEPAMCSTSTVLTINDNYNNQFSENSSDIDDADICDRSSPPPSYEEVTQEQLAIAGYGVAYGTI